MKISMYNLSKELKLKYSPISVILTDVLPENVEEFNPGKYNNFCSLTCVREAAKGYTIAMSAESKGCPGARSGMGFADETNMPGGIEYFLSCGRGEGFPEGERLKKTPEIAKAYYAGLPKNHEFKVCCF
ncbi:MAG: DUF169 domain-containing protein [Clostridia bacterium]|nr:DUF169 domain-containing protein [Clostridia bacterium]